MADGDVENFSKQAGNLAGTVGEAVGKRAEEVADQSRRAAAGVVSGAGRTAGVIADSVAEQAPAIADYVRGAGKKVDRLADDLREKTVGDLLSSTVQFGRSQPLLMLAGAALMGFALARLLNAGTATASRTDKKRSVG